MQIMEISMNIAASVNSKKLGRGRPRLDSAHFGSFSKGNISLP